MSQEVERKTFLKLEYTQVRHTTSKEALEEFFLFLRAFGEN
jgi:hypothetical protein